jgi:hypothetical protein
MEAKPVLKKYFIIFIVAAIAIVCATDIIIFLSKKENLSKVKSILNIKTQVTPAQSNISAEANPNQAKLETEIAGLPDDTAFVPKCGTSLSCSQDSRLVLIGEVVNIDNTNNLLTVNVANKLFVLITNFDVYSIAELKPPCTDLKSYCKSLDNLEHSDRNNIKKGMKIRAEVKYADKSNTLETFSVTFIK